MLRETPSCHEAMFSGKSSQESGVQCQEAMFRGKSSQESGVQCQEAMLRGKSSHESGVQCQTGASEEGSASANRRGGVMRDIQPIAEGE